MTRYIVEVTGEVMVQADSLEFAVTMAREMLGDDLSLAAQGMSLEVVASEVPEKETLWPPSMSFPSPRLDKIRTTE